MRLSPYIRVPIPLDFNGAAWVGEGVGFHPMPYADFFLKRGPSWDEAFYECGLCTGAGLDCFETVSGEIPDEIIAAMSRHVLLCAGAEKMKKSSLPSQGLSR